MKKEKEYKKLNKKITRLYLELPLGIMWFIFGMWIVFCMHKGGGENFLIVFGILIVVSLCYTLFIAFGTKAGKRCRKLEKELAKLKAEVKKAD